MKINPWAVAIFSVPLIVAFGLAGLIAVVMVNRSFDAAGRQKPRADIQIGQMTYLWDDDDYVSIATSASAFRELAAFTSQGNGAGIDQLYDSGRLLIVDSNAAASVTAISGNVCAIRIADGKHSGRNGLVPLASVHATRRK